MLEELFIENLAVIERMQINFQKGLHVFTGETGAGKSILIHGIQAVLGSRVSKDWVRTGCDRASVTALFTDLSDRVLALLEARGIATEGREVTLAREIRADGGSVGRINGKTASVASLREIGTLLLSIHGQHDNQILLSPENHLTILDAYGGDTSYLLAYQDVFHRLQSVARQLGKVKQSQQQKRQKQALYQRQIQEIEALKLAENEEKILESALTKAEHAERILHVLSTSHASLCDDSDICAAELVRGTRFLLEGIADAVESVQSLVERLEEISIELKDIGAELQSLMDGVVVDESRLQQMRDRYTQISLAKKTFLTDFDGLHKLYDTAKKEMQGFTDESEEIRRLEEQKRQLLEEVSERARALSDYRRATAERFVEEVTRELNFLAMPTVLLMVEQTKGKLTIQGMDHISFLISANSGEAPKPIAKIASGGELSRIMLALKAVIADKDEIPTLIFDEIDTGVSGKAAQKIGEKLREISQDSQVLCVTHLAQIAVMADSQHLIEKHSVGNRTVTEVHLLDFEGRARELARIMGGDNPSELMLENAREELRRVAEKKSKKIPKTT